MREYLQFLRVPGATPLLIASFPARFAYGMISLGLYFKVYQETHSIAAAGFAAGANGIAGSLSTGYRAALLDRFGMKWPLRFFVPSYSFFILVVNMSHSRSWLMIAAVALGACAPPINLSVRPMWKSIIPADRLRIAYAIDSTVMNIGAILGPVVVTTLALSSHPGSALIVCSVSLFVGGIALSSLSTIGSWEPEEKHPNSPRLFRIPGIRLLAVEGIFIGLASGLFNIALPAFNTLHHVPRFTSIVLAVNSSLMIVGSLLAGVIAKHLSPLKAFRKNYIFWVIAASPLAFVRPNWTLLVVAGCVGIFVGAQQIFYFETLDAVRPMGTAASALGWMWVIEGSAGALGNSIGGILSEKISPAFCFGLFSFFVFCGLVTVELGKKYLRAADVNAQPNPN
jgi:predicted MFS family arabinose efflux permease